MQSKYTPEELANLKELGNNMSAVFNRIVASEPALQELFATRTPRYRYWTGATGRQYHFTTERVNGKFWAQEFKPVGPGSRTKKRGKVQASKLVEVRRMGFATRKGARERAKKWYEGASA